MKLHVLPNKPQDRHVPFVHTDHDKKTCSHSCFQEDDPFLDLYDPMTFT